MKRQEIEENNNYRQGRSKEQQEINEKLATAGFISVVIMMLTLILYTLIITF